jgi:hypothetical protein
MIAALLLTGLLVGLTHAGIEPSPFHPLINQLNSVVNVLDAVDLELKHVLGRPPDPYTPPGAVGHLYAMAGQLALQNSRVIEIVEAGMSFPPDPYTPAFYEALVNVRKKAGVIAERASIPPDPVMPEEFKEALAAVEANAWAIVETATF